MAPRSKIDDTGHKNCTKCGEYLHTSSFYTTGTKTDGSPKYNSWCKACTKLKMADYHKHTYGPDALSRSAEKRTRSVRAYMQYLLAKARKRNICDIEVDDLLQLWAAQDGKCAMTEWPMTMTLGRGRCETNVSIDRVNSDLGYIRGNVQLVCRCVNIAKSDMSVAMFRALCAAVTEVANGVQNTRVAA